jgi:hypothetical protein
MRNATLALALLALGTAPAPARDWAEKMFKDGMSRDFGNVPRGAQLFHRFSITNIYAVRMEVTGLASGCGCVTAVASKRVLEPRETAHIDVSMDARRFTGPKTVVVRVTVGPEYVSSAELKVAATSRADVVFNPDAVNFGTVARGQAPAQAIDVEYAGPLAWQITEVVVAKDQPLEASQKELYRRQGQVGYRLQVALKPDAPTGSFKQVIYLKTNDPASPLLPVLVEGAVQSALTVSPDKLALGTVKAGEELTRRVVVRGSQPFRVVEVEGLGDGISLGAELSAADAPVQTVTFKCKPAQPGEFRRELRIKTSLPDGPVVLTIDGTATP